MLCLLTLLRSDLQRIQQVQSVAARQKHGLELAQQRQGGPAARESNTWEVRGQVRGLGAAASCIAFASAASVCRAGGPRASRKVLLKPKEPLT